MIENDDLDTEAEAPAVETVAPKGNYFDRYDPAPAAADPTAPLFGVATPVQPTVDTADIMGGAERRIRLSEHMAADGSLDVLAARLRKQRMMSSPMSAVPTEAETKARTAEWDGVLSDLSRASERDPTVAADLDQATRAKAAEEAPKPYRIYEGMPAAEREKAIAAQAKWLQGSFGEDGVFSDGWGKLTPEQQAEWVESTRADAEAEVDDVDKRLADLEAKAYTTPDGKKGIRAPRGTGLSYDTAKASLLREREKALGKRALIEAIDAGKADPATKTWYRSGAENIAKGVGADLLAGMIEFAGIARGYATRVVKGGDFDPASDALYLTGRQLRNLTETAFPGDPMRERELAQQVARGLGQMAGIYGSAGVAAALRLGPVGMAALTTLTGSSIEASQQFQAATQKMVEWDAKIAAAKEEGVPPEAIARMRANPPVSERERVLAVIFGSIVGASESVPLLTNWTRGLGPAFERGVSGIVAKGVEQSIEEGIQEFGQTYASDAVARWLYDPEREVGEQAADSALVGAILGFGAGSGTAAISEIGAKRAGKAAGAAKPEAKPTPEELPPELTMPEAVVPAAIDHQDIELAAEETGLPPEKVREALPFAAMITDDGGGPDAIARATRAAGTAEDPEVLRALEALTPRAVRKAKAPATPTPIEPALPEPEAAPTPPDFDPYSTSLLGTLMREGREPLVARLEQVGSVSQLREMASAQQITLSADMWESETVDVPTLASAIADGVQVRLNDRMAAAESSKRVEVPKAERVARKSTLGKGMAEVAAETEASGARAKAEKVMAEPGTELAPAAVLLKDGEEALADRLDEMSLAEIKRLVTAQRIEAPAKAKRGALVKAVMDHARARVADRMAAADGAEGPAPSQPSPVAGDGGIAAPTDRAPAVAAPEARETASVITPDGGMEVEVRPEIVDLADLTAASGDLQPRDRDRAESDIGIRDRAARLDPAQLMAGRVSDAGAPFYDLLEGKLPRKQWASALGVTEAELAPLIDDAVAAKWLRRRGKDVHRAPAKGRPARPAHATVATTTEASNAPSGSESLEPDWRDGPPRDGMGSTGLPAPAGADAGGLGDRGEAAGAAEGGPAGGGSVPAGDAASMGAQGDSAVQDGAPRDGRGAAGGELGEGGGATGIEGVPTEHIPAKAVDKAAANASALKRAIEAQVKAIASARYIANDDANIRETLPLLKAAQQDDVIKAEARLSKPDAYGFLLTNGTGTGKTVSGLGVISRFVLAGKRNILILAPSQGILDGWVKTGKWFGLEIERLDSTETAGTGIVATTYANLRANWRLASRDWDLIVPDEAHSLSQNASGNPSEALIAFRGLSNHSPAARARLRLTPELEEIDRLKVFSRSDDRYFAEHEAALNEYGRKHTALTTELQTKPRAKALFLSATPFAYRKSTDWAEGFLFDYPPDSQAYGKPGGRAAFLVSNFGYNFRYNRAEEPGPEVNTDVLEREFYERLKRDGALSGRRLEVDADYDRRFVLVDDAVGAKIDQALNWLSSEGNGRYRPLLEIFNDRFDYLARRRLLEAIKAKHVIPRIEKDLELGRKVVVFHDYNEGGGFSPFTMAIDREQRVNQTGSGDLTYGDLYEEFLKANPYVKKLDFGQFTSPIATLTKAFPDAAVYNGTISNKQRAKARDDFNKDGSKVNVIIVQSAAGEAGISLHDTTGKHQRVLYNLGLPTRPTTAIQQEGRIYREGQVSDAILRYMSTGTSWERTAFAMTIAERAGTAENLALGDEARALRDAFVDAFADADVIEQGSDEGRGGKEKDRTGRELTTPFDRAKAFYFGQLKKRGRRDQREGADYYATPEPVGLKMVEWADARLGEKMLEPSAGHGSIGRWFPESTDRTLIEPSPELASRAGLASPGAKVVTGTFEEFYIGNKFDGIVMNPPFGVGGKTAFEHVAKALGHLRPGGRVVALVPRGSSADARFEKLMQSDAARLVGLRADIAMPTVTFDRAGTSVATRILVIEKTKDVASGKAPRFDVIRRDLSSAETVNELFDRIENLSIPSKAKNATGGEVLAPVDVQPGPAPAAPGRTEPSAAPAIIEDQAPPEDVSPAPPQRPATARVPLRGAPTFRLGETTHSKTKQPLWVASFGRFVPREEYERVLKVAKANGGYYSAFKGSGAIPGFQFPSAEARAAFLDEITFGKPEPVAGPEPLFAIMGTPEEEIARGARIDRRRFYVDMVDRDPRFAIGMPPTVETIFYHGSEFKFDSFDPERIGRENGNTEGWGLYFSESKPGAEGYRANSTMADKTLPHTLTIGGKTLPATKENAEELSRLAVAESGATGADAEAISELMRTAIANKEDFEWAGAAAVRAGEMDRSVKARALEAIGRVVTDAKRGHLYEARLGVPPDDFAVWTDPVSKLGSGPKDALGRLGVAVDETAPVSKLYADLAAALGSKRAASEAFVRAGIPGVRYRGGPGDVWNYVLYDTSQVTGLSRDNEPLFAIGAQAPDIDSLGYYSKALEAAKRLPQAKGTPEQMLAQLRSAGVKEAEIEATGLDTLLASPSVAELSAATASANSAARTRIEEALNSPSPKLSVTRAGVTRVLTKGSYGDGDFRITRVKDGEPIGHSDFKADEGGLNRAAQEMAEPLPFRRSVTRDEIVAYLTENRVKLNDRVTGRNPDQAYARLIEKRIAEWEQYELGQAEFEYDHQLDDTHVYSKPDDWRAFAEQNGLKVDDEVFDDDPVRALADAGVTWESGAVPLWAETDSFLFGVTPNGSVAVQSGRFEVLKKGETVESYIAELEDSARSYIKSDVINADPQGMREQIRQEVEMAGGDQDPTRWSGYSHHPGNPTYREIVLYLPLKQTLPFDEYLKRYRQENGRESDADVRMFWERGEPLNSQPQPFASGHFDEPNITGHMMVSEVSTADGKGVLLIDQIQSDWGQKLRDGGVRDEAKIAELKKRVRDIEIAIDTYIMGAPADLVRKAYPDADVERGVPRVTYWLERLAGDAKAADDLREAAREYMLEIHRLTAPLRLADAELRTAEAATPGHPLVNTTDQWVDTTLRRGLLEAVRSGKDYIAIPSGKAVLAYNPGDEAGMEGFYDKIVPKNLRKILEKLDKATPAAERVETLLSPSRGKGFMARILDARDDYNSAGRGKGFMVFRITPEAKRKILEEGQPLFAAGGQYASDAHARRAAYAELRAGRDVALDPGVMKAVWSAAQPHLWIVPKDVPVAVLKRVASFDPQQVADYEKVYGVGSASGRAIGVFEDSTGTEIRRVIPHSLVGARALAFHPTGNSPGFIALVRFSGTDFRESVAGELRHELVHVLRRLNKISPLVWGKLLAHAKALRILDSDLATYLAMVKDPTAAHATGTVLDKYTTLYNGRRDFSDAMDEEYVAHLMELAYHRELLPMEIEPIRAEIEAFLAGDISGTAAARPKAKVSLGGSTAAYAVGGAGKPALDMSPEARKARAEAMGFDTSKVWYHGTSKDFESFDPRKANTANGVPRAVFLSDSANVASVFARSQEGARIIPVHVRNGKFFDFRLQRDADALATFLAGKRSTEIVPGYLGSPHAETFIESMRRGDWGILESAAVQKWIKRKGYGGWLSIEGADGAITLAVFDPKNIRSVNAEFDPAESDSANVMFAIGGSRLDDEPSLNDIIAEVKRVLDLGVTQGLWGVTVRAGNRTINLRPPKGMRGQYRRATGGISVRQSRDIGAIAHEGGHALEARYPELRTLMETHRNELAGMTGMLADYAAAAPVSEGFSEFFRSYLVSPDDAKAKAPRFYEAFEEFLDGGDVGLLGDLKDIQDAYKDYVALDPLAAMARDVVTDADRSLWSQLTSGDAFKTIHGWLGTAYTALIDDLSPVAKTVRNLLDLADSNGVRDADGKPLSLPVGENVYKLFRLFKDSYAQGRIWLTYGVTDLGGTVPKGPSLHDALVKAFGGTHRSQWSKKAFADFDAYLIARRAVAEYDRLEAKAKEIGVGTERLASLSDGRPLLARARDEASGRLDRRERALIRLNAVDAAHRREQASLARKADNLAQEYDLDPSIGDRRRANIRAELRVIEKRLTWLAERVGDADEMRSRLVAERDQAKGDLASARQRLTTRDAGIETTKRDLDRARKRGASRPPTLQGKAHHQAVIEQADREHPEWAEAAGMVNEFVHRLLAVRHQAGMITDEMFEMLSERKGWYVPFMRDMSDVAPEVAFSGMAGDRRRWSQFKKFDGSDRAILSPLSIISQEAYVVARQIAYNDAVKAFDRLVTRAGPGSAAIAERLEQPVDLGNDPFQRIEDIAIGMGIDPADANILVTRMEQETTHERISAMMTPQGGAPKALPVLPMWEGGRRVMLRLTDPEFGADVFSAINGLGKEFSTFLVDMAAAPARILRLGVTAHPDFMFRNLIRDLFSGYILTGAPPVLTHLRGFYHMGANTEFARNYASVGGIMAGEAVASISKAKDRLDISRLRKRGYKVSASVHGLYSIVGSIETAGRLGLAAHAYKRAKVHNPAMTDWQAMQEAAFVARDVIDYGRRGSRMLATARLVTFLNAQIQGIDKAVRALGGQGDRGSVIRRYMEVLRKRDDALPLSKDEERLLGASVKLYARLAAVNLFLYALYLLYADDEEYKDINDIKKSGMQPVKIVGEWMFLPKPFELALPGNLMEITTDAIAERDPRWVERMRESLFQTLAPPAVPQAFRLWRDMSTNIDAHSGREIVPSHLKDLAPHLQFDAWTSQFARDFSKALFDIGVPESAIPAPPMIDYLLTAGGAYMGREFQNDYAVIGRAAKGEEPIAGDWRDFVVIRGLTGDPERMSESTKRFWDLMSRNGGKLVRAAATYDELLKTAKPDEAVAYLFSDRLSPEQRAYAIVDQHYGRAEKRMHPMNRLEAVMRITSKIASEAMLDRLEDGDEKVALTPSRKEEVLEILSRIKRDEAVNTLRLMGEPGWSKRKGFDVGAVLEELAAVDPRLRKIYEDRLADKGVAEFGDVAEAWPAFRKELLALTPIDVDELPRKKGRTSREEETFAPN